MNILLLTAISLASLFGQETFSASANFSADLMGPADTREGTYGNAEAVNWRMTFRPPAGYRVRIVELRGDLIAWPRVLSGEAPVPDGAYAGVLLGFQTTSSQNSGRCDYCADNTMLYIQVGLDAHPVRAPFSEKILSGNLLESDNVLVIGVASWLNTTGRKIHIEPTFTVTYRFERERD